MAKFTRFVKHFLLASVVVVELLQAVAILPRLLRHACLELLTGTHIEHELTLASLVAGGAQQNITSAT